MQSISVRFTPSPVPMPMSMHKPENIRVIAYYHITPSYSLTPTLSPTPSLPLSHTPSPSLSPTHTPSPSPAPSPSLSPTHTPSPSPAPSPSPIIVDTTIIFTLILITLIFCYRSVIYRYIKKYRVKVKVNDDNNISNLYSVNFKNTNIHQQLHPTAYNKLNIINRTTKSSYTQVSGELSPV